jgi:Uma2 family endonuclease
MSTAVVRRGYDPYYPTGDGKPMAETPLHRNEATDTIHGLEDFFAADPMVYIGGNMLFFYEEGNRNKHVAPDVFLVKGIGRMEREHYLLWQEGKGPDWILEVTSKSTKEEDLKVKMTIYQDILKVTEYVLFDPTGDYLDPPLQGYRRVRGKYRPIPLVEGRLPSLVLGLHLEIVDGSLRLFDPRTGQLIPTRLERIEAEHQARLEAEAARQQEEAARQQAEEARRQGEAARQQAEEARRQEEAARQQAEAEVARLKQELADLKKRLNPPSA